MPQAQIEEMVNVSADQFFKAITSYESYPKIVDGFKKVQVSRKSSPDGDQPGRASVDYTFSVMFKKVGYQLEVLEEPKKGRLSWSLIDSDFFKINNGEWIVTAIDASHAKVKYSLEAEFKIAVPEMILNQLLKGTMPSMVRGFEKFAKGI